jgi:peptidyl-prolyl cis-trans isomerase C
MAGPAQAEKNRIGKRLLCATLVLAAAAAVSACGDKEKKSGQALASVDGAEVTVLQLNEEMRRSNVQAAQQEAASKQLLEALIDRQLLQNEASKDKTDRDPKVMQSIERAKDLIVGQAYMQKRVGEIAKPTKAEVEDYFQKHPEFFTRRKQFDMRELIIASKDMSDELKAAMDASKTLEEVALWLEARKLAFVRTQLTRTSADLAPELSAKLLAMPKGQLFIIREGERTLLISIADIKDNPVALEAAAPQIQQFLFNKKSKEAADAVLAGLRAAAKIEYLNKPADTKAPAAGAAPAAATAPAAVSPSANDRGVAGLK